MTNTTNQDTNFATSTGTALAEASWLDVHFEAMRPEYEEALRWVGIQRGWHVLDAACGSGSYLPLLTELVGYNGRVSAMDIAPEHVQTIQARATTDEWAAPVEARLGNLLQLPYDDASFDATWCANTTQYLTDAELETTLRELVRVTRPGGLVAIKDNDITALQIQPSPTQLFARFYEAWRAAGNVVAHGCLRTVQLGTYFQRVGLREVCQRHFPMVRSTPLRAVERRLITDFLKFVGGVASSLNLSVEDHHLLARLAESDAPDHITNRPDFMFREVQIVFVGRV